MRPYLALLIASQLLAGCGGRFETRSSGIDFATDVAAIQPFGLAARCRPGDGSCTERASQLFEPVVLNLSKRYDGPGVEDASGSPVDGSLLLVFHRDPAVPWRAAAGETGSTKRVAVDVGAYLMGTGDAYVVIDSADMPPRFTLPDAVADELIAALYLRR